MQDFFLNLFFHTTFDKFEEGTRLAPFKRQMQNLSREKASKCSEKYQETHCLVGAS